MSPLLAIPGLDTTSPEFRRELCSMAHRLELEPSYIAAAMAVETGRTFSPSIRNPYTGAVGLVQFMPSTCLAYVRHNRFDLPKKWLECEPWPWSSTRSAEFIASMTAVEQLAAVEWYFERCGALSRIRRHEPGDYYMCVFMPKHVGKPRNHVLFVEHERGYAQNKGLDRDGNGRITVSDVWATVEGVVAEGVRRGVLGCQEDA